MPETRGAEKKLRQDKKQQKVNLTVKSALRDAVKKYRRKPTQALLGEVYSLVDTASKKKIFHANKAARMKSRLSKLLKPVPDTKEKQPVASRTKKILKRKTKTSSKKKSSA